MQKAIYVTRQGARMHRHRHMLAVSDEQGICERWPPDHIHRVLLFGNVQITAQALALLMDRGAHVCLFSASGRFRGQITPPASGNVFLRLAQHARLSDMDFRLEQARGWVRHKIRDAREGALRYRRNHPELEADFEPLLQRWQRAEVALEQVQDLEQLRGLEGSAAAAWFQALGHMVRPPFVFQRRSRRPARDEVNALLNLGYTMLALELAGRLEAAGFDPRVGLFHGVRYGRHSLALDLLEPYRVDVIDRMTLSWLNRRMFAPNHFYDAGQQKGIRLKPKALRRYLSLYEEQLDKAAGQGPSPRERMEAAIDQLRRDMMAEPEAGFLQQEEVS